jgi:Na+-driven multidrug efflux pump
LLVLDYALIFGRFGLPEMGLQGSAVASVVQHFSMTVAVLLYILFSQESRKYAFDLLTVFRSRAYTAELIRLSWPVFLDKTILAAAYIWLLKMIAPMGSCIVATFCVIKDMERVALAPALAFASVITFLVSNDYGRKNWQSIKSNIKKTVFLGSFCVMGILFIFSLMPEFVIGIFDKKGEFVSLAARAFPILSMLAFFDLLQVILSGALRGAANVKTVMMVRLIVCGGIFVPLSYCLTFLPIEDQVLKFIVIYGSFYMCNGIMSFIYINRFRSDEWKKQTI